MAPIVYRVVSVAELWQLRRNETVLSRYDSRDAAVEEAYRLAGENRPSRLIIHAGDGQVEAEHAYSDQA